MVEWKDTSTHSKEDKEKIPNSYTWELYKLKLSIHRHIYYPKDQWLCSCYLLNIEKAELMNKDTEKAKQEALNIIKNKLLEYHYLNIAFNKEVKPNSSHD